MDDKDLPANAFMKFHLKVKSKTQKDNDSQQPSQ
jgi:hypothetical protein